MNHLHFQPQTCNFLITVFYVITAAKHPEALFFSFLFSCFHFFQLTTSRFGGNFKDENLCLALITKIFILMLFRGVLDKCKVS